MPDKPHAPQPIAAARSPWLRGAIRVPGDRAASTLALASAAMARGESTIRHLAVGPEVAAFAKALRQLGASVTMLDASCRVVGLGTGGLLAPEAPIELGGMGEAALLLIALLGVHDFETRLAGYVQTPMGEALLDFLHRTGTRVTRGEGKIALRGPRFALPLDLRLPMEALALKAPLMLAALAIAGTSYLRLDAQADPAEDLLGGFGAVLARTAEEDGGRLAIEGLPRLRSTSMAMPSDPVLAAFPAVAALIAPDSEISVDAVSTAPQRMGVLDALRLMGADIGMAPAKDGGRDTADLVARHGRLSGTVIPADLEIDPEDFPILAVAASFAKGETLFEGLGEGLGRLNLTRALRANGVDCEEREAGLAVRGSTRVPGGGTIAPRLDPKLAMAFLVLGMAADKPVTIEDGAVMAEIFPGFVPAFEHVGCRFVAGKAK